MAGWFNAIIAGFGILGKIFDYVKHGKVLKSQAKILNDLQIEKAIRERDEELSADFRIELKHEPHNHIAVTNVSRVDARGVQLKLEPDIYNMPREFPFPRDMAAGQTVDVSVYLGINGPKEVVVKMWWEDVNHIGNNPSKEVALTIFS